MARDCDRCRFGLMRNKWLADYPNEHEFESALPCSTCTDAGSRFEQAKGAPLFEDTRSHRNQCTIHDGFENPGKHTWQPALSWEIEYLNAKGESGDPDLVSLIAECLALSEEDLKRAARVIDFVLDLRPERRAVLIEVVVRGRPVSEVARERGVSKQAVSKCLHRVLEKFPALVPLARRSGAVPTYLTEGSKSAVVPLA